MPQIDPRVFSAAQNNADLYEAIFSAHELSYTRKPCAFVAKDAPPPFYSHLVTLQPDATQEIRDELKTLAKQFNGRIGLKDSFCRLDLAANGFSTLFEAQWLWRTPAEVDPASQWRRMTNADELELWETAWKGAGSPSDQRQFPTALLAREGFAFFAQIGADGGILAGCIANRSSQVIGLSNVFARQVSAEIYDQAARCAAQLGAGMPIVGYESGSDLALATASGFETIGGLRILVSPKARF